MAKKQFKAESKRLLDLMVNSIYTHKEIFLRELISNASDALDKLAYIALTDDSVGLSRSDFAIELSVDKEARTLTISDNGVGMTQEDLEKNLGTIAHSGSLEFKKNLDEGAKGDVDIIGQFGVGFYSAFMVADLVTVTSRAYGSDEAWRWESDGADGYTITPAEKERPGTDIVLHIKPNEAPAEDGAEPGENYDRFLETWELQSLVKKYSDYVRFPIRMDVQRSRMKERPADAGDDYQPEWESYTEHATLNSMIPLWQRPKAEITDEAATEFYRSKFADYAAPLSHIAVSAEGLVQFKALLFIPAQAPYDYYSRDFEKGLQLYSSGVLIMERCADLLPDCFRFVRGVVDTQDLSLNISRELLQHTRELRTIAQSLERRIKGELKRLLENDREKYDKFWTAFGRSIKYETVSDYGVHKDLLSDLLLFPSTGSDTLTTLDAYVERMPENQKFIYYASGESTAQVAALPQCERISARGYEILCLTSDEDEFVLQGLHEYGGKEFRSVDADDALEETDEEKAARDAAAQDAKEVIDFVKETLGDRVHDVRVSNKLVSHPVFMSADGPVSLEMEKYFRSVQPDAANSMRAQRVLELNPVSPAFEALRRAVSSDKDRAAKYAEILYSQALLIAGLPLDDASRYTDLVCGLLS